MESFKQCTDKQIIEHVLCGETALFEILIRRYNPFLYKTGRSYNYNHEDTQDLMQDTFIDAYKNLAKFENRSGLKTWLIKIMLNHCFHKREKFSFKNEIVKEINDYSKPVFMSAHSDTGKIVVNRELNDVIENALQTVPFDYRMVFSLREITGLSVYDTAEALEISESNVKVRLNRAKTMLRREIEKSYTAQDIYEFNLIYCDAIVENVMQCINNIHKKI